jgi:hypothetical protein
VTLAAGAASLALLAAGCGEGQRNAHEPKGSFAVEVVRARFPRKQAIARDTQFELVVRNAGSHTIPDVAVTVDSFNYASDYPHLAANKRPIWIVNDGPGVRANPPVESEEVDRSGDGETAFTNTWALGPLAAGARKTFLWLLTPVKAGRYTVHYTVSAGLDGRSLATLPGGGKPVGQLVAEVAPRPPHTHVNPETGEVAPGANRVSAGAVGAVP